MPQIGTTAQAVGEMQAFGTGYGLEGFERYGLGYVNYRQTVSAEAGLFPATAASRTQP